MVVCKFMVLFVSVCEYKCMRACVYTVDKCVAFINLLTVSMDANKFKQTQTNRKVKNKKNKNTEPKYLF